MMSGGGDMIRESDLHSLCIKENWFTSGSSNQFEKLFECLEMYNAGEASLYSVVAMIYVCSSVSSDIHERGYMKGIEEKLMSINRLYI